MSLSDKERIVFISNVLVMTTPDEADPISLSDLLELLKALVGTPAAREIRDSGGSLAPDDNEEAKRKLLYLADVKIVPNSYAVLLFNFGDRDSPDPAFTNFLTRDIREVEKEENEGVAYSAHLMISLTPNARVANDYRAIFERVPHLSKAIILPFLNRMLSHVAEHNPDVFSYANPEDGEVKPFRCRLDYQIQQSQTLRESLENGELSFIELVQPHYHQDDFDEDGYTKIQSKRLSLKVTAHKTGNRAIDLLEAVRAKAADEGYTEMRVRYKREETDKFETAPIPIAVADASDVLYGRKEKIDDFDPPLSQCVSEVVGAIEDKMLVLLRTNRLWS